MANDIITWPKVARFVQQDAEKSHVVTNDQAMCECSAMGESLGIYNGWGVLLQCPCKCKNDGLWIACTLCPNAKKKYTKLPQVKRHERSYHRANVDDNPTSKRPRLEPKAFVLETVAGNDEFPTLDEDNDSLILSYGVGRSQVPMPLPEENNSQVPVLFDEVTDESLTWINPDNVNSLGHSRVESSDFFKYQHLCKGTSGGMEFLAKKAIMRTDTLEEIEQMQFRIPREKCLLHIQMANLAHLLACTHHDLLASVAAGFYRMGNEDGFSSCYDQVNDCLNQRMAAGCFGDYLARDLVKDQIARPIKECKVTKQCIFTRVPYSSKDIRKLYMEGKFAIIPNLPHPEIKEDVKGHAYLSIIDCIIDFLSRHNTERLEAIHESTIGPVGCGIVERCCQSERSKVILQNAQRMSRGNNITHVVANRLDFWSDDFEANTFSKTNRNSVWLKTFTIGTVREDGQQKTATYPIAIGKKGIDHDPIEAKIAADLQTLKSGELPPFYIGSKKKCMHIHFELFTTIQDQLERRSANKMMPGSSGFCARWLVSADHVYLLPRLRACFECISRMKESWASHDFHDYKLPECRSCLNWDALRDSPMSYCPLPTDYPRLAENQSESPYNRSSACRIVRVGNEQMLRPFRITYEGVTEALSLAFTCFCSGNWSTQNCFSYLKVEGLNTEYIQKFMEHAVNALAYKLANESSDDTGHLQSLRAHAKKHPEMYVKYPPPALSDREGVPATTHIDAIMHLLFLGIVKESILKIQDWLLSSGKNKPFIRECSPYLDEFNIVTIEWLNIQPYKGEKFGGWVSENYLGFSRIMLWFYQNIDKVNPDTEDLPPAIVPHKKWLKRHNTHWLKVRGLNTNGTAPELANRVASLIDKPDCPQPIAAPTRKVEDIESLVVNLQNMLSCVMSLYVTPELVAKTGVAVRLFLSVYDGLDESLKEKREKKSEIATKYNFISLLNLPERMREFGPLRNLWEGGSRGEGYLRTVKPLIKQGMRRRWEVHLLKNLLIRKSLSDIQSRSDDIAPAQRASVFSPDYLKQNSRMFHKYRTKYEFLSKLSCKNVNNKVPISVILVDNEILGCRIFGVVLDYKTIVCVSCDLVAKRTKFGLEYFWFSAKNETQQWADTMTSHVSSRVGYGLLLPLLDATDMDASPPGSSNSEEFLPSGLFAMISSDWKTLNSNDGLSALIYGKYEQNNMWK